MLDFETEKIKNKNEKMLYITLRDVDGEINGGTVSVNKALNKQRSFSESMASDIKQLSRFLIVRTQQVLYSR